MSIVQQNCFGNSALLAAIVGDPSSTGSVKLNLDGSLKITPNYLDNDDDLEALGAVLNLADRISNGRSGPSREGTCPSSGRTFSEQLFPNQSFSDTLAAGESGGSGDNEDLRRGNEAKGTIISPHHFAGTASLGRVVENDLRVIGVQNLYVADASALPRTPRVNTMASAMMMGRIAGSDFD